MTLGDNELEILKRMADGLRLECHWPTPTGKCWRLVDSADRIVPCDIAAVESLMKSPQKIRAYDADRVNYIWKYTLCPAGYRAIGLEVPVYLRPPERSTAAHIQRLKKKIGRLEAELSAARAALAKAEGSAAR